jgi:hypothetical protein
MKCASCRAAEPVHPSHYCQSCNCGEPLCRNAGKAYTYDSSNSPAPGYCQLHACQVQLCPQKRGPRGRFCENHACSFMGCTRVAEQSSKCGFHAACSCGVSGCNGMKAGNGRQYCCRHACAVWGCADKREGTQSYCQTHTCARNGCVQQPVAGSQYCRMHPLRGWQRPQVGTNGV